MQGRVVDRFCARSEAKAYLSKREKEGAGNPTELDGKLSCSMSCDVQAAHDWCGEATQVSQLTHRLLDGMGMKGTGETPLTSGPGVLCLTMKVGVSLSLFRVALGLYSEMKPLNNGDIHLFRPHSPQERDQSVLYEIM